MKEQPTRTEDDLRAAFQLAAQDAPSSADVLARLAASQLPKRSLRWGTWAPLAAAAAVLIAVAVPVLAITHNSTQRKSASTAAGGAAYGAQSLPSAEASGKVSLPSGAVSQSDAASAGACTGGQVTVGLAWTAKGSGLAGSLTLTNHSAVPCTLDFKPSITPIGADGKALDVRTVITAEGRVGPSRLLPGASASAAIGWAGWCGPVASTQVDVDWGSGTARVTATGPTTPSCTSGSPETGIITSSWFNPLS
jgi:hypothetical protein